MKINNYELVECNFFNGHMTNIWLGCKIEKKDSYFFTTNPLLYGSEIDNSNSIFYKK